MSTASSTENPTAEISNPPNLTNPSNHHDHHNLQITTDKLNGSNCLEWSQLVRIFLKGRGKMGYLDGTIKAPGKDDAKYNKWEEENFMIMSWLLNSMQPEISKTCLFLKSPKEIWDKIQGTYSKVGNTARIFELKGRIGRTVQGDQSVTSYYNKLEALWQELDHDQHLELACVEDSIMISKMLQRDRIFEFLNGLNKEYEQIRSLVLSREVLPSLMEVFSCIRDEEARKNVMMGTVIQDGSAFKTE